MVSCPTWSNNLWLYLIYSRVIALSDELFFIIKWYCDQCPIIFGTLSSGSLSNSFDFCCFSLSLYQNDTEIQLDFDDSITTKLIEILQHISFQICSAYTGIKIIFQEMNQITPSKFCFVGWKVEGHWFGSFYFFLRMGQNITPPL